MRKYLDYNCARRYTLLQLITKIVISLEEIRAIIKKYLAGALPTSHAPRTATLVARLDHIRVRYRHYPHLVFEHVGWLLDNVPRQRSPAVRRPVYAAALVRRVRPVCFPLLNVGLQLVVVGGQVVDLLDGHLLGRRRAVATLFRHFIE